MSITNAKHTKDGSITATFDGVEMTMPVDAGNRHYAELIASGVGIEASTIPSIEYLRQSMHCSKMQGILTLGETKWGEVLAYRETATWAEKMIIDSAQDWHRTSENIQFIGYLVGYTDAQMDDLFAAATLVKA
tara:strand:+ start:2391 stop:2789 length:399 start_codon:yes stop_codon:yes gene_type:complete